MDKIKQTNITIIIKDKRFETTRERLSKCSEYFENLFTECKDVSNELTIDSQDPVVFEHILKYFNDITYKIPEEYNEMVKFYLIKDRHDEIYDLYQYYSKQIEFLQEQKYKLERIERIEYLKKLQKNEYAYNVSSAGHQYESFITIKATFDNLSDAQKYVKEINNWHGGYCIKVKRSSELMLDEPNVYIEGIVYHFFKIPPTGFIINNKLFQKN